MVETVHRLVRIGFYAPLLFSTALAFAEDDAGEVSIPSLQPAPASAANALTSNSTGDANQVAVLTNADTAITGTRLRPSANTRRTLNNYLDEIERVETEFGAYGNGLAEQLSGLGEAYQIIGRHDDAIEVFKRAAHINRINEGLYNLNQVPIMENMIESLVARGQWQDANERREYLYWLYKRNYGQWDPRMLPVMDSLSNWYLNVYAMNRNNGSALALMDAYDLFSDSVKIINDTYGEKDLRKAGALRGLTISNWYFNTYQYIEPRDDFGNNINYSQKEAIDRGQRLTTYISNSYVRGKAAITELVDLYADNPNAPPGSEAGAMVELGDWYMLFNKWRSAIDTYQEAHNMLQENSNDEVRHQIDKLFSRPVALPDLPLMETTNNAGSEEELVGDPEDTAHDYVVVSFDVTRFGSVRNVDILESIPEDSIRNRTRVKNALKNAKFRPRFVDGQPVLTEHVTQRYVFND